MKGDTLHKCCTCAREATSAAVLRWHGSSRPADAPWARPCQAVDGANSGRDGSTSRPRGNAMWRRRPRRRSRTGKLPVLPGGLPCGRHGGRPSPAKPSHLAAKPHLGREAATYGPKGHLWPRTRRATGGRSGLPGTPRTAPTASTAARTCRARPRRRGRSGRPGSRGRCTGSS